MARGIEAQALIYDGERNTGFAAYLTAGAFVDVAVEL